MFRDALFDQERRIPVTGASGAFGAVAAETLASAGAKLLLTAGKTKELAEVASDCRERGAGFLVRVPKGRLGEPADIAGPLLFLASNASNFYTGHILYADGGYTAG